MLGRVSLSATCGGELRVIQCDGTTLCRDWVEEGISQTAEETPMTIRCSDGDNSTIREFDAKGAWWLEARRRGGMLEILDEKMGKNYFRFFSSRVERRESWSWITYF